MSDIDAFKLPEICTMFVQTVFIVYNQPDPCMHSTTVFNCLCSSIGHKVCTCIVVVHMQSGFSPEFLQLVVHYA